MLEYRREHNDPEAKDLIIEPRMIVVHYTAGSSLKATWRYFNQTRMESARKKLAKAGEANVSAHFLVDRDGTVYRLMAETQMARHCIGLNHVALGIENIGGGKGYPLTDAQVDANAALIRHLTSKHKITHVVGHHEAWRMEDHAYFRERDPKDRNRKPDPGPVFMQRVRAKVSDLNLQGPPGEARRDQRTRAPKW